MFILNHNYVQKEVGGKVVLVDINNAKYLTLNETGSLIIKGIQDNLHREEIVANIVQAFDVDEDQAESDCTAFTETLVNKGILTKGG